MKYSRQTILDIIGEHGQEKLRKSTVAIVGVGALGGVAAELLARAGVGKLILIDRDLVEPSNLQRQTLFGNSDVGQAKAMVAGEHVHHMNPDVAVDAEPIDLDYKNIAILDAADLILDGTDNLETRHLINEYCINKKKPWIFAAGVKTKGYVFPILPEKACLNCFLSTSRALGSCDTLGVINTLTATVAAHQVTEALKLLTHQEPESNLLHIDAWEHRIDKIHVPKDPKCRACNGDHPHLDGTTRGDPLKFCGSFLYQIRKESNLENLRDQLEKIGKVADLGYAIQFDKLTIFPDRVLVKADSPERAKSLLSKYVGT